MNYLPNFRPLNQVPGFFVWSGVLHGFIIAFELVQVSQNQATANNRRAAVIEAIEVDNEETTIAATAAWIGQKLHDFHLQCELSSCI
jgi:hypothetical protein